MRSKADFENALIDDLASFSKDPYRFVLWAFPWGEGELAGKQPEPWQAENLKAIRDGLITVSDAIKIAIASGHGIGKSAFIAWVMLWAISTMGDARGVVTANTDTQLKTKTWPELGKWYRLFIGRHLFRFTATALYSADPDHEKTWRIDAIPWSETNTEAFQGLHNRGRRVLLVFDEASGVADPIWDVAEGATTDADTEIIWLAFGNPTRSSGRFRECFEKYRHRWRTAHIDSRTVSFTNKTEINKMVEDHGEDSDYVRVRVRGVFPNVSAFQFIPADVIEAARGKHLNPAQYSFAPVILTLDPAWTGGDEWVIGKRQGLGFSILAKGQKNNDDSKLAGLLARLEDDHNADAVFIDLGYGTGVYSVGKSLNRTWQLVAFGGASSDEGFLNKRAEMWSDMKEWLSKGGAIPDDPVLCADLAGPEAYVVETGKQAGKVYLESKDDMKARGLASPNRADALALSFAFPVIKKGAARHKAEFARAESDYDPLAEFNKRPKVSEEKYEISTRGHDNG